jgi:transposase-like protein
MNPSKKQYSDEFKEQALAKVYSRGKRTIQAIADESNLSIHTLKNWMKSTATTDTPNPLRQNSCRLKFLDPFKFEIKNESFQEAVF